METYAYLIFSLGILVAWFLFFIFYSKSRKEMIRVSFWTMFLGLTEPFFVPEYWNPPTLFDLARRTGFDIESLIFSFAIGGIVSVFYEAIFKTEHTDIHTMEMSSPKHRFHFWAMISAPVAFFALIATANINPIYSGAIACIIGFFTSWYCRPDLLKKMVTSGFLFLAFYFFAFFLLDLAFPGYVGNVWNLPALSGVMIIGVPLEELMFAFTFGLYWSSVYEHIGWKKLK